jgi:hypothetical protein
MADHAGDLNKLRKLLVEERRKLVAKMVGSKHKLTKLGPLVEIRHALRAVDEAIEEEETKAPSPRKAPAHHPASVAARYSEEVPDE